jgi:DNA-binding NtrC family response regulator
MREMFKVLDKVSPTEVPVMIQGESGTGKELVARAIHENGPRQDCPFVSENVAAVTETLLESELFGHVKGAFTGATANRKGLFEIADGGSLFLDEIGDMSLDMQKKLLRVLQEGEIRPVGGETTKQVNVRVIAASNKKLKQLVEDGLFREDLYYRVAVMRIDLPPLRDRREDIPVLARHFLEQFGGDTPQTLSTDAQLMLVQYDWPGNVRELENEILRLVAMAGSEIEADELKPEILNREAGEGLVDAESLNLKELVKAAAEGVEAQAIREALRRAKGVKSEAARILEVSRPTLDAKLDQHGIDVQSYQIR